MPQRPKRSLVFYIFSGLLTVITIALAVGAVYFNEEITLHARGYGYASVFVIGVLCGISVIPVPTLLLAFTMGKVLNPLYVGLIAGFGGGIGGISVYLTGAGMMHIGSRFWPNGFTPGQQIESDNEEGTAAQAGLWAKGRAFYHKLLKWVGGKGGSLGLFIVSAMIISPFYFAGLAAGSLRMGLLRFFLVSWAGKTVRYLIVAYAGYWGLNFLLKWIGA